VTSGPNKYKFTGKERDTETGLDYFGARYYGSNMGRFMSPDSLPSSAKPNDPQTWNRYSYVLNRPTVAIDPDGQATLLVIVDTSVNSRSSQTFIVDKNGTVRGSYFTLSRGSSHDRTKTGADTPFGKYKVTGTEGGKENSKLGVAYGTGKVRLEGIEGEIADTGRTDIRIHGGGTKLGEHAYDANQGLVPTAGCVRAENADVNEMIGTIKALGKEGDPVDYAFVGDETYLRELGNGENEDLGQAWRAVAPQEESGPGRLPEKEEPK
jgi:RHS repeat-associated protein